MRDPQRREVVTATIGLLVCLPWLALGLWWLWTVKPTYVPFVTFIVVIALLRDVQTLDEAADRRVVVRAVPTLAMFVATLYLKLAIMALAVAVIAYFSIGVPLLILLALLVIIVLLAIIAKRLELRQER